MPTLGDQPQGPVKAFFPKGENAILGVHVFNVIGSGIFGQRTIPPTGTPTGVASGGIPGVSATYSATGSYAIRFPTCKSVDIDVAISSSSGYMFHGQVQNQSGPSGSGQLEITRLSPGGGGSTGFNPIQQSGFLGYLPTGTKVMLQFMASPTTDGLTSY